MDIDGQGKQGEILSASLLYYLLQCTFYFRSPPASVGKKRETESCTSLSCLSQDTP